MNGRDAFSRLPRLNTSAMPDQAARLELLISFLYCAFMASICSPNDSSVALPSSFFA
jgi:hypothetical protein